MSFSLGVQPLTALGAEGGAALRSARIDLPAPPKARIPPRPPSSRPKIEEDLKRKREERQKRDEATNPPPKAPEEQRKEALIQEVFKDRPMRFLMELALVQPKIVTPSGSVQHDYQADLTTHLNLYWRYNQETPIDSWQFWYGFRLAPFAGSGFYKDVPGRFGFLYFGPIVAVGKFSLAPVSGSQEKKDGEPETADSDIPSRSGWLVAAGVAAQSRIGEPSSALTGADHDFSSKGLAFDRPGLWTEARYIGVHYGALSLDTFAGAQAGVGKYFVWLGLGFGALY